MARRRLVSLESWVRLQPADPLRLWRGLKSKFSILERRAGRVADVLQTLCGSGQDEWPIGCVLPDLKRQPLILEVDEQVAAVLATIEVATRYAAG